MSALWGEIASVPDADPAITALEREQLSKPRCVDVEGPAIHQPSVRHFPPVNEQLSSSFFETDSLTHHTIQLVQYTRKLTGIIHSIRIQMQEQQKSEEPSGNIVFPPLPHFPTYDGQKASVQCQKPLHFISKDIDSSFEKSQGKTLPEIDSKTCRKLLRKSMATVCAHSGYDTCRESTLETLTDISHEYLLKLTEQLRVAVDEEAVTGSAGFPDVVERVLQEMGTGSRASLQDFYQTRIIGYHDHMIKKSQTLQQEYENMKNPDYKFDDPKMYRLKEEPYGDSNIHFPSLSELDVEESVEDNLQLEGLGFDITVSQSSEESGRWSHGLRGDTGDSRLESYDQDDTHSTGTDIPHTPAMSSEAGESLHDPGSVSGPDITSPPPATLGIRTPGKPPKKKKKT